jgi:hypothetical protein
VADFILCFMRESAGHWTCVKPCEISLAGGRMQVAVGTRFTVGTRFMDVDVADLLDRHHERALAH